MILKPFMKRFKLRSANPAVLPLQIFVMLFFMVKFQLLGKNPTFFQTAIATGGGPAMMPGHGLCVFLCITFLNPNENPLE